MRSERPPGTETYSLTDVEPTTVVQSIEESSVDSVGWVVLEHLILARPLPFLHSPWLPQPLLL